MNPDKLFDYLDGRLNDSERTELEAKLASNAELQRELAIAREIHRGMSGSRSGVREVIPEADAKTAARGAIIGRRVAIAFAALIFLNVIFGLYAVGFMAKKQRDRAGEEKNRQQLQQSLEKAAATALPTPTLDVDEIEIAAPEKQVDAVAKKVIAAAAQSGGSAVKNLSNENGLLLFAEIPAQRENDFRQALAKLGAALSKTSDPTATGNKILQIRIVANPKP